MEVDLLNFLGKALSAKDWKKYEPNCSDYICSEFTVSKKKWICFSIYRPPSTGNIETFFQEMNELISVALCKYENLIVMADFNIVEKSCDKKPNKIGTILGSLNNSDVIDRIIKSNQNHPSVLKIKNNFCSDLISFDFQQVKPPEVKNS